MEEQVLDSSNDGEATCVQEDENINISDVIEVIETDPDFNQSSRSMFNGIPNIQQPVPGNMPSRNRPYVRITEQPASKALRFRYECEGRSAGSIPGASSTPELKTFPSIQVVGYKGRAVVVVSCVTKDEPYRPHPHNLVGREGCKRGVCTLEVNPETMSVTFSNLGIQCVKKKDIEAALRVREEIRVDPFRTGFGHRNQPTSIDLNAVRLCFQVFIDEKERGKFNVPLQPVVSEPIYDKKAMSDLMIVKISHCSATVDGGRNDVILLCEKVTKEDIQVRFFEIKDNREVWQAYGEFQPSQVHKQTAIWFRPPRYERLDITEPVKVFIQLKRPSDNATSDALPFEFLPLDAESGVLKRKRQEYKMSPKRQVFQQIQESDPNIVLPTTSYLMNIPMEPIKIEPRDTSPSPYQIYGNLSPMYPQNPSISPQNPSISPQNPSVSPQPPQILETLSHTIPPASEIQYNIPPNNLSSQVLPPISNIMAQNWNIPSVSTAGAPQNDLAGPTAMNIDSATGLSSLLDMDSQQLELKQLNSGELATLNTLDATINLSETFNNNLSLSDIDMQRNEQNMTDSLTRLANKTIDNLCYMNDVYKP